MTCATQPLAFLVTHRDIPTMNRIIWKTCSPILLKNREVNRFHEDTSVLVCTDFIAFNSTKPSVWRLRGIYTVNLKQDGPF